MTMMNKINLLKTQLMEAIKNVLPQKEKKALTPDVSKLIVKIIEDDTNVLHTSLGITDERARELQDMLNRYKSQVRTTSELLVVVSKEVLHANELAFISYALGTFYRREAADMQDFLGKFFGR